MPWLNTILDHWREHGGPRAHKRGCFCAGDGIGDLVQIGVWPYCERRKRSLVKILVSVLTRRNLAIEVVAIFADIAFATAVTDVAEAYAIASCFVVRLAV